MTGRVTRRAGGTERPPVPLPSVSTPDVGCALLPAVPVEAAGPWPARADVARLRPLIQSSNGLLTKTSSICDVSLCRSAMACLAAVDMCCWAAAAIMPA